MEAPRRRIVRAAAPALLALLPACATWSSHPVPQPDAAVVFVGRARVTRTDSSSVVLRDARVNGDSIRGRSAEDRREVAIALADVRRIEAREAKPVATGALVTAAALGALAAWAVYSYQRIP